MENKPKILFLDIETSPNLMFSWGLGKTYLTHDNIHKERKITCISYKWAHEKKVHSLRMDLKKHDINKRDDDADKAMLVEFSKVYAEADLAVAHNGVSFDVGMIKARLIRYGLPPLAPTLMDDTYRLSKSIRFNSHKLAYLAPMLGVGKKKETNYGLWIKVMMGDKSALDYTVKYCEQDVLVLEKVYNKLLPHINSRVNRSLFYGSCPKCHSTKLEKRGFRYTLTQSYQRYQCKMCYTFSSQTIKKGVIK
jgi:uncharacterized protein YprB with RNaseH-like and TPR domain